MRPALARMASTLCMRGRALAAAPRAAAVPPRSPPLLTMRVHEHTAACDAPPSTVARAAAAEMEPSAPAAGDEHAPSPWDALGLDDRVTVRG